MLGGPVIRFYWFAGNLSSGTARTIVVDKFAEQVGLLTGTHRRP